MALDQLLNPIRAAIFKLLNIGAIKVIDNDGTSGMPLTKKATVSPQRMQVFLSTNELIENIPRYQEYGLETYPDDNAFLIVGFQNGDNSNGVGLCAHDSRYRPTDLAQGEVALYTKLDKTDKHRVHLKESGAIENTIKSGEHFSVENGSEELISLLVDVTDDLKSLVTELKSYVTSGISVSGVTSGGDTAVGGYFTDISEFTSLESSIDSLLTKLTEFKK